MSIHYNEQTDAEGKTVGVLHIDNGDLQAFRDVMEQYGFVNQEALVRYALVALLSAGDNKLYVKKDENIVAMNVAEKNIKKDTETT